MWISKGSKSFSRRTGVQGNIFGPGKGFFLQAMLYNAQLGRLEDIYFQEGGEQSRKFISIGGEHGAKQLS